MEDGGAVGYCQSIGRLHGVVQHSGRTQSLGSDQLVEGLSLGQLQLR